MRAGKARKLKTQGWALGDAADFLQLSPEEMALVELRSRLADGLRLRRIQRNLTQQDLARVVRSSQSRVAKMEAGDATVTLDLLLRSLLAMGVSSTEIAKIISAPKGRAQIARPRTLRGAA